MENVNLYSLFNLITRIYSIIVFLIIVYLQIREVFGRPKDFLTKFRRRILILLLVSIIATVPSLIYQFARSRGLDSEGLRNAVTITGGLFTVTISHLMLTIWRYKGKDN